MNIPLPISPSQLAKKLGISPQAVGKWTLVPHDRVLEVCRACDWKVTPHELRSDIYPFPTDGVPQDRRPSLDPDLSSSQATTNEAH